ncbi:predicted protein [Naegleria gruberi]|uniref:Predicted protein n=1 Tax=Naegleria gruberi TaxID=5762 RepID=D2VY04_NAEGR|nr:uncharacterized protein NAEGRDRAFT_59548 [Naegleria gruberi]EFC38239.1 predicted protein [Naegleria gruberi]|eukprot:XP_002670983.1 predicted protein [Naegleria gruberi strain NEG-M]
MDPNRLIQPEETFDKQIVSNLSVDSSTCVSEHFTSLTDEENSNQSSSLDYSLSSTSNSSNGGANFNYSVENLKLSLSTNGNVNSSNNRVMNASFIDGNESNLMSESFVNHSQMIVSNVGLSNCNSLPVVAVQGFKLGESQPKSNNILPIDKESCKDSVNIVNSIQKIMDESEPCMIKHENFRPTIKLSPQKHALFLKKKKMNRRESILNQVKLSSRLTGNKHSCRIGPAKRKDLSLEQMKSQRLDKKNNFHLELDLDILFTEKLVEKLPILVESSNDITETVFEMHDEKQAPPIDATPTNSTTTTTSPHHLSCNFSCKYCNDFNRNCTINNSIKETQHEVFNIVKYNLVKLKDLLDSDDLDFEDSIDSVLESDCVQTLISYLDTSIYGKYFSLKQESCNNCKSMSNLSMKDILSLQLVATQVVKKLSCGRMDQVETLVTKLTITKLILLINSMCDSIRYEALWICGNLAKHHHNFRDDLLDSNVLNEIVTLITGFSGTTDLNEDTTSLLRMAAWCFSKLCFGTVFPKERHMRKEIELLDKFLSFEDSDILKNVCRALGRLMLPKEMIDVFLKTGRLPKIVDLLKHVDDNVIGQALVAAVNISAGTDEETQELVTLNALNVCYDILKSNKSRTIKVDAMILVSNIAACTEKQVECAVECGVLELVANLFHNRDTHIDMKKEAVWIFSNSTSNGTEQHLELFTEKYQILVPVAKMVMNCNDTNVVTLGLQTLLRIVQYYDEDKEPEQLAGVLAKLNECGADKYISQMDTNRYGTAAKLNKYFTPKK